MSATGRTATGNAADWNSWDNQRRPERTPPNRTKEQIDRDGVVGIISYEHRELALMRWPTMTYCATCRTMDHSGVHCSTCPFCMQEGHAPSNCKQRGHKRVSVEWSEPVLIALRKITLNYLGEFCDDVPHGSIPTAPSTL